MALHRMAPTQQGREMSRNIHVFTSVTTNYIPKARVLATTVKKVYPSLVFHLVLSDEPPEGFALLNEPFDNLLMVDDFPIDNLKQWIFSHRLVELCTAVKGCAMETIFEKHGAEKVFYFDPDIAVFGRMQELSRELDSSSILLTPHQTRPEKNLQGIIDNEMCSLRHGVFNLGFIGVANTAAGREFSQWWRDRLLHFCRDDYKRSLFTDQKWVDLVPGMFDGVKILRSPGFNVATWNLSSRTATGSVQQGIQINGEDLGFYHFSGLDSGAQERQLKEYGSHSPVLFDLREWYIDACEKQGQKQLGAVPCKYNYFDNGKSITDDQRRLYSSRKDLRDNFPDPFSTSKLSRPELTGGYQAWYEANIGHENIPNAIEVREDASMKEFLLSAALHMEENSESTTTLTRQAGLRFLAILLRRAARMSR
jgi:hypothetical protein